MQQGRGNWMKVPGRGSFIQLRMTPSPDQLLETFGINENH